MEELDAALAQIAERIIDLADKHGRDAFDLAAFALQLEAIGFVLAGLVSVGGVIYSTRRLVLELRRREMKNGGGISDEPLVIYGGGMALGLFIALMVADKAFNPLVWRSMFDPYVAITAKALGRL